MSPNQRDFATGTAWTVDRIWRHAVAFAGLVAAATALAGPLTPAVMQLVATSLGAATAAATLWPATPAKAVTGIPRPLHWAATTATLTATALTAVLLVHLTQQAIT